MIVKPMSINIVPSYQFEMDEGVLLLKGTIDFSNVMSIYEESLIQLAKTNKIIINFFECDIRNSACIALILEWIKWAKLMGKAYEFVGLSDSLLSIAKIGGLHALILPCMASSSI